MCQTGDLSGLRRMSSQVLPQGDQQLLAEHDARSLPQHDHALGVDAWISSCVSSKRRNVVA